MEKNMNEQENQAITQETEEVSVASLEQEEVKLTADEESTTPEERKKRNRRTITRKIAVTAVFSALAFLLYWLGQFCKLSFAFPNFLELHFSELPALIAGFCLGPQYGAIVVIVKCLLKMPLSGTVCVGEATDIFLGLAFVLPASFIYRKFKSKKGALLGVGIGTLCLVILSLITNCVISIPFYTKLYFHGDMDLLITATGMRILFPGITVDNFYGYYLGVSVIPFNLLRGILISSLSFVIYKRLSRLIKRWTEQYR